MGAQGMPMLELLIEIGVSFFVRARRGEGAAKRIIAFWCEVTYFTIAAFDYFRIFTILIFTGDC